MNIVFSGYMLFLWIVVRFMSNPTYVLIHSLPKTLHVPCQLLKLSLVYSASAHFCNEIL